MPTGSFRVVIVSPTAATQRTGNTHTAQRYARFLRAMGVRVRVTSQWTGQPCDAMIALHAKKSGRSALAFAKAHAGKPLVVVLTGTDLYRDLSRSALARRAVDAASAIVVLQSDALRHLKAPWRKKATVIVQSAVASQRRDRAHEGLRVLVLGHLRSEKDPLRAALALQRITRDAPIQVSQAGAALDERLARSAERLQKKDARYRYLGEVSRARAQALLAASDVLVVSSRMEGGANVVSEAIAAGIPVVASHISGNVGLLGPKYPAYFAVGDTNACARALERCLQPAFLRDLRRRIKALQPLVKPQREQRLIQTLMKRLLYVENVPIGTPLQLPLARITV